jgi:hypothetical protein
MPHPLRNTARQRDAASSPRVSDEARGLLTLEGPFLQAHASDLASLLRAEAARARTEDPSARILTWDDSVPGILTLSTSTTHLVVRLGHALHRAFGGTLEYFFSRGDAVTTAHWMRD